MTSMTGYACRVIIRISSMVRRKFGRGLGVGAMTSIASCGLSAEGLLYGLRVVGFCFTGLGWESWGEAVRAWG